MSTHTTHRSERNDNPAPDRGYVTNPEKYEAWIKKQADGCGASHEFREAVSQSIRERVDRDGSTAVHQ